MTDKEYKEVLEELSYAEKFGIHIGNCGNPFAAADAYVEYLDYLAQMDIEATEYEALIPNPEEIAAYDAYLLWLLEEELEKEAEYYKAAEAMEDYYNKIMQEELAWYNYCRGMGYE